MGFKCQPPSVAPRVRRSARLGCVWLVAVAILSSTSAAYGQVGPDGERATFVPESRSFLYLRDPTLSQEGSWGAGLAFLWVGKAFRFNAIPGITPSEQSIVLNRVDIAPFAFWTPWATEKHAISLSAILPLVVNSGAESRSVAAGDLTNYDGQGGFDLGDVQLAAAYVGALRDDVFWGAGLDIRLPTGRLINERSLAEGRLFRLIPRLQIGWRPVESVLIAAELGELLHIPGAEDVFTVRDGRQIWAETMLQAGVAWKALDWLGFGFELAYWFDTVDPASSYSNEVLAMLNVVFDFGPDDTGGLGMFAQVGGGLDLAQWSKDRRFGPLYAMRGKVMLEVEPRCDGPVLSAVESHSKGLSSGTCVSLTDNDEWIADWVTIGNPLEVKGSNLGPDDLTAVLDPDTDAIDVLNAVDTNGTSFTVRIPEGVPFGQHTLRVRTACDHVDTPVAHCPVIDVTAPAFLRFTEIEGRFTSGLSYVVEIDGQPLSHDGAPMRWNTQGDGPEATAIAQPAGTPPTVMTVGAHRMTVRPADVDGCPGRTVDANVREGVCCAFALQGFPGEPPAGQGLDSCEREASLHFDVATFDTACWAGPRGCKLYEQASKLRAWLSSVLKVREFAAAIAELAQRLAGADMGAAAGTVGVSVEGCASRLFREDNGELPKCLRGATESEANPALSALRANYAARLLCAQDPKVPCAPDRSADEPPACSPIGPATLVDVRSLGVCGDVFGRCPVDIDGDIRRSLAEAEWLPPCISAQRATIRVRVNLPGAGRSAQGGVR